ncbi:transposase [Burkholderia gladioli]|nr:transposase [Burkholderia gladioli]
MRQTFEPGATISGVARRHQVNANQVFAWRKLYQDGLPDGRPCWRTGGAGIRPGRSDEADSRTSAAVGKKRWKWNCSAKL